ncbi:MAG: MBL fold metallo-hydrolase [Desulfobulbaceae bacterium]|nr:MBL fold metallo-hydrolase [Desulfobulbaceae bacterium]
MKQETVRLKIIVDNQVAEGFVAEHGFALLLEVGSQTILFDTGQGNALLENAKHMNINLEQVDLLVLSHGHYDHTGGLPDLLHLNHHLSVYCHAAAFLPRYSVKNGMAKPVKMTAEAMACVDSIPEQRINWVTKQLMLTETIGITGEIPRINDFETTGGPFYFDQDGKRADAIVDDMALWVKSPKGLVICIGCCHAGIINTLEHIKRVSGETKIHTILGGLHLLNADEERLSRTVDELKKSGVQQIIPCHCTGDVAHELIRQKFNSSKGYAGMEISI